MQQGGLKKWNVLFNLIILEKKERMGLEKEWEWIMKTTVLYHVVGSDDVSSKQVVNNEGEFIECLVKLKYTGRFVIDDVVGKDNVTFIKMDIEGSELEALRGASKTIQEHSPKLAISVYHKPEDIIDIPLFISEINSGYKFYLRHYTNWSVDTVLYAIPI